MDRSRKANREGQEATIQFKSRQETQLEGELIETKLTQLLAFVGQLERTPVGSAEVQRRVKLFGQCTRNEGDTSAQYYARLRRWLDRDLPQTKSPLHPPRQTRSED